MKSLQINDDVYESLKAFVVDPFDDTPNAVLMRLIGIAHKAQSRWCSFDARSEDRESDGSVPPGTCIPDTISADMNLNL